MLARAPVSDEALMGYSLFLATVGAAMLVLVGLGVFAYDEGPSRPGEEVKSLPAAGRKERPPYPTTLSLFADGTMVVHTNPLEAQPFPREDVGLVFAEMLLRKVTPPLILRCNPGVTHRMVMEILVKARDAGLQDIRLAVPREMEKP